MIQNPRPAEPKVLLGSRHFGWTAEKFMDPHSEIFRGDFFPINECLLFSIYFIDSGQFLIDNFFMIV